MSAHIGFKAGTFGYLLLKPHKEFFWNNGFMVILKVILRNKPLIHHPLFGKEVRGNGLLQESVTHVLFVSENFMQR